jgi:hypothetical protein
VTVDQEIPTSPVVPVPPGGKWTITTVNGITASGYLPGWADNDPSRTDVSAADLHPEIEGIIHRAPFDGQAVQLLPVESGPGKEGEIFGGAIVCIPDSEGPEPAEPYVEIQIVGDAWFTGLGPDDVATVAAALRAQADRLDHDVRPRLIAYRNDWAAQRVT